LPIFCEKDLVKIINGGCLKQILKINKNLDWILFHLQKLFDVWELCRIYAVIKIQKKKF
jgi:hypothetical protein